MCYYHTEAREFTTGKIDRTTKWSRDTATKKKEDYIYLGFLEADGNKRGKMGIRISEEYINRQGKLLKSKLNSGHLFRAISTLAVSLYRYGASIVEWTKDAEDGD